MPNIQYSTYGTTRDHTVVTDTDRPCLSARGNTNSPFSLLHTIRTTHSLLFLSLLAQSSLLPHNGAAICTFAREEEKMCVCSATDSIEVKWKSRPTSDN